MNKLLIGLLVAAAGTGIFFLVRNQKKEVKPVGVMSINKDALPGTWKTAASDTNAAKLAYDFQKDGLLLVSKGDPVSTDSLLYQWNEGNELSWKRTADDSAVTRYKVTRLTADSLDLQGTGNTSITLTKEKR